MARSIKDGAKARAKREEEASGGPSLWERARVVVVGGRRGGKWCKEDGPPSAQAALR